MLMTEAGIMAEADARVFGMLMSANRTARRLMAADRTMAGAYARVATLRRMQDAKASRQHERADRELARELGASITPGWGRTFLVRMPVSPPASSKPSSVSVKTAGRASTARRAIRAYAAPLRDSRGRVALYMKVKYRGFGSKGWRPGLSADHIGYILRDLALEMAEAQLGRPISNMGERVEEIEACWRALEEVEAGYRANSKVQYRIVWNLPHELDADQRRGLVEEFCERTFGRLGLPYIAAIHEPDAKSDRRNYHAHICFSTRPCERISDHEWAIAEEKINGLTDKPGLRLVRSLAAAHMNRACRSAGLTILFTHQTYAERGLDAERQTHVGPEAMAAHDRGEFVGVIARNAMIVEQNEAAIAGQRVEQQLDATAHLRKLLEQAERASIRRSGVIAGIDAAHRLRHNLSKMIVDASASRARRSTTISRPPVANLQARAIVLGSRAVGQQRRRQAVRPVAVLVSTSATVIERITNVHRRSNAVAMSGQAARVAGLGASTSAKLMAVRSGPLNPLEQARTVIAVSAGIEGIIAMRDRELDTASRGRVVLAKTERQINDHREAERNTRIAQVRTAVMTNPTLICTVIENRMRVDLGALADADRVAFLSLDADVQRQLIMDRHKADELRRLADEARRYDADRAPAVQSASLPAAQDVAASGIIKPLPGAEMQPLENGMGLSLGRAVDRMARRPLDVPKEAGAFADGAVDRGLRDLEALGVARAEAEARRDLVRRNRAERERAEAERARKAEAEQHERKDAERQQREGEHARLRQAEKDASNALDAMLIAIEAERNLVGFDEDACFVDEAVLKRFEVTTAAIASAKTQARLEAIADRQRSEIEPMVVHATANGGHIVEQEGRWTLSSEAPGHLRRIANIWAHEPQLQRAFAEAATTYFNAQARVRPAPGSAPVVKPAQRLNRQQMLILAAAQREVLTDRWQQNRRFDDGNIHREAGAGISKHQQTPSGAASRKRLLFDLDQGRH